MQVKWRPVIWGLVLQFLLALFILQTRAGYEMFNWLGDVVQMFLDFSDEGAKFVFGDPQYLDHFFAFKVSTINEVDILILILISLDHFTSTGL